MPPSGAPFQVLCVEDDRITVLLFEEALRSLPGVSVRSAESVAEALQAIDGWRPHLMVIDAHLPDGLGASLLAELRRRPALDRTPAYLCTADDGPHLRDQALAAGFVDCWFKPVEAERWRALVQSLRCP